jgi:hypothetical protein
MHPALILTVLSTLGACVSELDGEEELVDEESYGETTQELFGTTTFAGGSGTKVTVLGEKGATHTCFLRGIRGSLDGTQGNWGDRITAYAKVKLNSATDRWEVHTKSGYGGPVYAHHTCVATTAGRTFLWAVQGGNYHPPTASITTNRRCFLTGISAYGVGMKYVDWDGSLPGAKVWKYGGSWRVSTWFADNSDGHIDGSADAVCINISGYGELGDHYIGNADVEIYNGDAAPWSCGAMGVFGVFTGSTDIGAYSYKSNNRWRAKAPANKGVLTKCFY